MRLASVRIRNFRCYKDEFTVELDDLTLLVGRNDVGKSSIFDALAIFFDEGTLDSDDASVNGDKKDVRIICEFDELPDNLVLDADYPTTLRDEHLLNERGRLEIHKMFNGALQKPKLTGVYARAVHPTAQGYHDLLQLTNSQLKQRAKQLGVDISGIDERINTLIRRKIWGAAGNLDNKPVDLPLDDKEATKSIWEQIKAVFPTFALFKSDRPSTDQDAEAQDPMKAAIKEALKQKESELNTIAVHVENEVRAIAQQTVEKLREMDPSLANQLTPRFTPPNWSNVFKVSLSGDEDIPVNKRGSGTRRLILLNFFRAKAEQLATAKNAPSVIYAIEEPETSQHPNNQKMLIRAFSELADQPNCQIILSTHTPVLARLVPDKCLRYIDNTGIVRVTRHGDDSTRQLIAQALGVLPDHDVKLFIGVEGINDINFLRGVSRILKTAGEPVPDLGDLEYAGQIIFFPLGGSNLALWKSKLAGLNRPEIYIFDRDVSPPDIPKCQSTADDINKRPNCKAFITAKRETENYLHPDAIQEYYGLTISFNDFDDVPEILAHALHAPIWSTLKKKEREVKVRRVKAQLNSKVVEKMTAARLSAQDKSGDVRAWLAGIAKMLVP